MSVGQQHKVGPTLYTRLRVLPGLVLCGLLVVAGMVATQAFYLINFAVWATILGAILANTMGVPKHFTPGVAFAVRPLLRIAIVLLGLQIPIADIVDLGWRPVVMIVAGCVLAFVVVKALAKPFGVDPKLAELIAGGTAICGASAVVALNSVTSADEQDAVYALSTMTVLGAVAMLALPAIAVGVGLDPSIFALWAGASIHEVGQVAGAAAQFGQGSEQLAMTAKLLRVMMLGPLVFIVAMLARRDRGSTNVHANVPLIPGFVLGFFAALTFANAFVLPPELIDVAHLASTVLLAMALAGLGLTLQVGKLIAKGVRPLLLAITGAASLMLFSVTGFQLIF